MHFLCLFKCIGVRCCIFTAQLPASAFTGCVLVQESGSGLVDAQLDEPDAHAEAAPASWMPACRVPIWYTWRILFSNRSIRPSMSPFLCILSSWVCAGWNFCNIVGRTLLFYFAASRYIATAVAKSTSSLNRSAVLSRSSPTVPAVGAVTSCWLFLSLLFAFAASETVDFEAGKR